MSKSRSLESLWDSIVGQAENRWRTMLVLALLLVIPSSALYLGEPRYSVWLAPVPFSIVPIYELRIAATPSAPVLEGTAVNILVTNNTEAPQSNVSVKVIEGDGTILYDQYTGLDGSVGFEYPGHPVIVYAETEEAESRKILVGRVPSEWVFATFLSFPGWVLFLLLAVVAIRKTRWLERRLEELEAGLEEQRVRILSTRSVSELREEALQTLEDACLEILDLPPSFTQNQISRDILLFLSSHGLDEYLLIGLALAQSEATGNKRLDRKFTVIALVQTFEELLLLLGRLSYNEETSDVFRTSSRLVLSRMFNMLFPEDTTLQSSIREYGSFDRSMGKEDFDSKLALLLRQSTNQSQPDTNFELPQPALDFTIVTLVRNYTHHSSDLDSDLFVDSEMFESTMTHILGALIRAFVLLHPMYIDVAG